MMATSPLIEMLSEKVHESWMAEKQRQGFADHTFLKCPVGFFEAGECAYPREKHHTDMLPYAELGESTKDYDRATVRAVLAAAESAGFNIVQIPLEEIEPDAQPADSRPEYTG